MSVTLADTASIERPSPRRWWRMGKYGIYARGTKTAPSTSKAKRGRPGTFGLLSAPSIARRRRVAASGSRVIAVAPICEYICADPLWTLSFLSLTRPAFLPAARPPNACASRRDPRKHLLGCRRRSPMQYIKYVVIRLGLCCNIFLYAIYSHAFLSPYQAINSNDQDPW
jgi:hypothetical protein